MKTKHWRLAIVLCLLPLLLLICWQGCRRSKTSEESREMDNEVTSAQYRDDMLLYAIDNLNGLEEFSSGDSLNELLQRFNPENPPKPDQQIDPLLAAWPEPEMFRQIVDQFNQWIRAQQPPADWKLDPLAAALPKPLQELPQVKNLGQMEFSRFDGFALQEAAWLRAASLFARGDVVDDLDRARNLFDWTVRNIQLEADRPDRIPQLPRETLLFGRGTASERAWVFILLLRQLDIEAAVLAIDEQPSDSKSNAPGLRSGDEKTEKALRPWCVGVLIEGEAYLFDPMMGLPIPAPNGVTLDETGQLAIRPATLAQVVADAKLLRRLDIDPLHEYAAKSLDFKQVTVLLEASPAYLAKSMKVLESHLSGKRKLVLTTSPTVQAARWKAAHVAKARLWLPPFETLYRRSRLDWQVSEMWLGDVLPLYWVYQERLAGGAKTSKDPLEYQESREPKPSQVIMHAAPLYRGRVLYLKGKFGDEGAAACFRIARPSRESLARSSDSAFEKQMKLRAKQDASYWFGLMAYQRANYPSAIDYFLRKTIEAYPNGPWLNGARYNLARTYEASGKPDLAVLLYGSNSASPGYPGDVLRARWLTELGEKRKPGGEQ